MKSSKNLGEQSSSKIVQYLRLIGDHESADRMQGGAAGGQAMGMPWRTEPWQYSGILLGYLSPIVENDGGTIENAATIAPDASLKNTRIKVSIDRFRVHRYPGLGQHRILCEFAGKNQIEEPEELRYAIKTEATDGASASLMSVPIFIGVSVGKNGISFEGRTVNLGSDLDDDLLAVLESGPLKEGLSLLTTLQPALKPFVGLAQGVVGAVLKRAHNKQIHAFKLGLDFASSQTGAKLRHGSFIVLQGDAAPGWTWSQYAWNASAQQVVDAITGEPIPFNYMIFRVSPHDGD